MTRQKFAKEKEKERQAAELAAANPPPPTLQQRLKQATAISGVASGTGVSDELERLPVVMPKSAAPSGKAAKALTGKPVVLTF